MISFQQKRGFRNIIHSRPVLVFLAVLIFLFAFELIGFMGKMRTTIENRKIVENKLIELQKEKDKLSADISKLKTDSGVEESIRDKFGLVKNGENVIVIVEDKNKVEVPKEKPKGFFSFFTDLFR